MDISNSMTSKEMYSRYKVAQDMVETVTSDRVVSNDVVFAHWIDSSNFFWYEKKTKSGKQYRLVDAELRTNLEAFDHELLANLINQSSENNIDSNNLPLENISVALTPLKINFDMRGKRWSFLPAEKKLYELGCVINGRLSPNGKLEAFVRDANVYVRTIEGGGVKQLTQDGVAKNAYAGGIAPHAPIVDLIWSPDSRLLFTQRLDRRKIPSRLVVDYVPRDGSIRPKLVDSNYGFPCEENVEAFDLVVIDVENEVLQPVQYRPIPYSGYGVGYFDGGLGWWAKDSARAYFVDVERDGKCVRIVELNANTGLARVVFEEKDEPFVKLWYSNLEKPIFLPLAGTDELIWWSERSGWGHLYLYDLKTGELKNHITGGEWLVRDIVHYDSRRRELVVHTAGRDPSISPYYRDICSVNIDTGELKTLLSGNFDSAIYHYPFSSQIRVASMAGRESSKAFVNGVSSSGDYMLVSKSRVDTIPETILINRSGKELLIIEVADVSGLPDGWVWPEPITVKAADGKTSLYGVVYRPPNFSEKLSYPVIDFSMGYRVCASAPQGSFRCDNHYGVAFLWASALAALGFIVIAIEGRGTSYREKSFQTHRYGDPGGTSDFNDRVSGIKQLATKYPYMDIDRVGVTGVDNEANTIYGMLDHPDFYKVGVIHCYTDPRFTVFPWAEQMEGVSARCSNDPQFELAEHRVSDLEGKLLLTQGMLDVFSPAGTFRLVDALYRANKDFDMICLPSASHEVPNYIKRRTWDYLVRNLQHVDPPLEFPFHS